MLRVAKPEGFGNIVLEEAPIPVCGPRDVLVKNQVSLISRGSEVLRRYMHEEAIDPAIMGYSVGGVVAAVGAEAAARFQPGDRVVAVAPHAQYVLLDMDAMEGSAVWPLPADISFEQAAFLPLVTGGVTWAQVPGIRPGDTVAVTDSGTDIDPTELPHLFERFYRADRSRTRLTGSSGLGLAIARQLVQAHHGRIWAESPPPGQSQGSVFYVELPVEIE